MVLVMNGSPLFEKLLFWHDLEPRSGAENMAVDECLLLAQIGLPILRVYGWAEPTVSFGYFDKYEVAREMFGEPGLSFLRRSTGGGMVDHRVDVTYSLVIPRGHTLAEARGDESYAMIHRAVALVLKEVGVEAELIEEDALTESPSCFEHPVAWDIVDGSGKKLAGAGQRRSREGLLHQGSVQGVSRGELVSRLPAQLSPLVEAWKPLAELRRVREVVAEKYGRDSWLRRR